MKHSDNFRGILRLSEPERTEYLLRKCIPIKIKPKNIRAACGPRIGNRSIPHGESTTLWNRSEPVSMLPRKCCATSTEKEQLLVNPHPRQLQASFCSDGVAQVAGYIYARAPSIFQPVEVPGSCPAYKPNLIRRASGQPREPTSRSEFGISNSRRLRAVDRSSRAYTYTCV